MSDATRKDALLGFEEYADPFPDWPNCTTPDCGNKQCTWAGMPLCFPCGERAVGRDEMIRRYNAAHDVPWHLTPHDTRYTPEPRYTAG